MIGALKLFDQAFIVSRARRPGGLDADRAFSTSTGSRSGFNYGYGAAIGVVLFPIIFSLTVIQRLLFGKAEIGY